MKMKITSKIAFATIMAAFMLASCSKYPGFKKTESGIYYKFFKENKDSVKAMPENMLTLNIKYRVKISGKDSVLFTSAGMARPFEIVLKKPEFKGDIYEAFAMLHKGDSATFILSAKDFFQKTAKYPKMPEGIDSTSKMFFDVKLVKAESMEAREKAQKAKAEKLKSEEPAKLQNYLTKNNVTVKPNASGIYIITKTAGSGRAIQKGDFVKFHLGVYSIEGKKIFNSMDNNKPMTLEFGKPFDTKGFEEAIGTLKKGSKATVLVPSEMGFGEKGKHNMNGDEIIPPFSTVVYDIEILDLKTKAETEKAEKEEADNAKKVSDEAKAKEPALIQQYVKDNKITTHPTASGLYYIEKVKGNGPKALPGKKVKVHYTGKLFNGKVFDTSLKGKTSAPFEFVLGKGQVIPGWDEGISMMCAGGKATLVIPSKLGYGDRGAGNDIPPFAPLVFDVELISISDK